METEQGPELWVFGGRSKKIKRTDLKKGHREFWVGDEYAHKFSKTALLGSIYNFEQKAWQDIPVSP